MQLANPLKTNGKNSYRIIKISFKKKGSWKKISYEKYCLWVGRRWEPIIGYISKFDGK